MNNYDYMLNDYTNRAYATNDFNLLTQFDLMPKGNQNVGSNMNQYNGNANMQMYTPKEAFDRGNLFRNLYDPYKNYKPVMLEGKNEKERLYLEFARMAFAAHELNLYLDNFPSDTSIIQLFNDYRKRADELEQDYERKYGPISISSNSLNATPFIWEQENWPWEEGF